MFGWQIYEIRIYLLDKLGCKYFFLFREIKLLLKLLLQKLYFRGIQNLTKNYGKHPKSIKAKS
ncbi:hypothetical protein AR687_05275 [Flavobacteriaceae bacterium CRH]|nr:hypothetical protein AR687_05275 [Flavobacteriaceae bacterium CRH]